VDSARDMADKIDVMLLCSGSRTDLPVQGPEFAAMFNIVDGFDTHNKIRNIRIRGRKSKRVKEGCCHSCGWDPGMFSLNRLFGEVILLKEKLILSGARA